MKRNRLITAKFLVATFMLLSTELFADTPQISDRLTYQDKEYALAIGWGHPSPLERYFYDQQIKYPFHSLATNNYRGHVAFWTIEDDQLILKKVYAEGKQNDPSSYGLEATEKEGNAVFFASWFSGILLCQPMEDTHETSYYFHVKDGQVVGSASFSSDDRELMNEERYAAISKEQKKMLVLYQNYITYFFRLGTETMEYEGENCQLYAGPSELSPFYNLYGKQHLEWPYHWENLSKSGAPNCTWLVIDGKIYLKKLELHAGLRFDHIDKEVLDMDKLLGRESDENGIFADWIDGIIQINHGSLTKDENSVDQAYFQTTHFSFLRFKKGRLIEAYKVKKNFNFEKIPRRAKPGLKAIIKEYKDRFQ